MFTTTIAVHDVTAKHLRDDFAKPLYVLPSGGRVAIRLGRVGDFYADDHGPTLRDIADVFAQLSDACHERANTLADADAWKYVPTA